MLCAVKLKNVLLLSNPSMGAQPIYKKQDHYPCHAMHLEHEQHRLLAFQLSFPCLFQPEKGDRMGLDYPRIYYPMYQ